MKNDPYYGDMITLLITLVVWGLIFWLLWWALGAVGLPEPFNKVATVLLVLFAVLIVIGILTGSVSPFAFNLPTTL